MEPPFVVDLVDEAGKVCGDIVEGVVFGDVDRLDLERFHEAFGLGVVVGISAPAHRADEAVGLEQGAVRLGGVLRAPIRVVDASRQGPPISDCSLERGDDEARVDRAAESIADHPPRPGVEDYREVDESHRDRDVEPAPDPDPG